MALRSRDVALIDALDSRGGLAVDEFVWRIVREGREATDCTSSGGRWDDGTFDVLYTSRTRECSLAEMDFHLRRGLPLIPSKPTFVLYELRVRLHKVLDLSSLASLSALGLDSAAFGRISYAGHRAEYPSTQEIAEVAHFLGFDGLLVPSARVDGLNIIVFCDRTAPDQLEVKTIHGPIDWASRS